jgi:hypothetical protein
VSQIAIVLDDEEWKAVFAAIEFVLNGEHPEFSKWDYEIQENSTDGIFSRKVKLFLPKFDIELYRNKENQIIVIYSPPEP